VQYYTINMQTGDVFYPPSVNTVCQPKLNDYALMCIKQAQNVELLNSAVLQFSLALLSIFALFALF
jgi:hypothetical protein